MGSTDQDWAAFGPFLDAASGIGFRSAYMAVGVLASTRKLKKISTVASKSTLHTRGYKPKPGERTLEGYVEKAANQKEIGLNTNSQGFDFTGSKQFKRFGADSHGDVQPHVHQPIRNITPKGPRGGTGSKTKNGGVTSPTQKDVKQLYDHLNNGKY